MEQDTADADLPWQALFNSVMGDTRIVGPEEDLPLTGDSTAPLQLMTPETYLVLVAAGSGWQPCSLAAALLKEGCLCMHACDSRSSLSQPVGSHM